MRQAIEKTFGSLKTLTLEGKPNGAAVILFHGYGADFADLLPVAEMMGLPQDVTWVFPNAPMEVIIAPGFYGRAWFQIDSKRLEEAVRKGEPSDLSESNPPGLESARKLATSLYDDLLKKHSNIVIGGFSQGAMLATELALTHAKKPAGLVVLSGALICKSRWQTMANSCAGLQFFQSHGKNDAILGYAGAEKLFDLLTTADLNGDFMQFSGGHEIPAKVIERLGKFLRSRTTLAKSIH
jgi:phospholipase/carboxylesterase